MKKYLRLLGAFTIASSSTPSVIAASPFQSQAQQNKLISESYSQPIVESLDNINNENVENETYFINSTAQEIKNFKNMNQSFRFVKKIKDIFDNELYFIQYEETSAIVSISNYETLEISNNLYDEERFDNEIIYIPSIGLVYKENNQLYSITNNLAVQNETLTNILSKKEGYNLLLEDSKIENKNARDINFEKYNKEIKTRKKRGASSFKSSSQSGTYANDMRVSHEVPNSWWFRQLDSDSKLGYAETSSGGGLCEYIALSMLILYQELFVSSGYLTDSEIEQYFNLPNNSTADINNGLLEHKYYKGNLPSSSFVWKLYSLLKYATDIKTGNTISKILNKFLTYKYKSISGRYKENWSTSSWHSSSPEDLLLSKKVPVMLSFVYGSYSKGYEGHNLIIYGYDKPSKKFLVNFGWSGSENSQRLLSKSLVWSYFSWGYWYALYHNEYKSKLPVKKLFSYNSNRYTSAELKRMGVI